MTREKVLVGIVVPIVVVILGGILAWMTGLFENAPPQVAPIVITNGSELADKTGTRMLLGPRPEQIHLSVSASDDRGDDNLLVDWVVAHNGGPSKELQGANGSEAVFSPTEAGRYVITARVEDVGNGIGLNALADSQSITIQVDEPRRPEARIRVSSASDLVLGDTFSASGRNSFFEPGSGPQVGPTYVWDIETPDGDQSLGGAEEITFEPNRPGVYTLNLKIEDRFSQTNSSSLSFTVSPPQLPVPRIEVERTTVSPGEALQAIGVPQDNDFTPSWIHVAPSGQKLRGAAQTFPFSARESGSHMLEFTIKDVWGSTATAEEVIVVLQSDLLDPTNFDEQSDGARLFDFSSREVILAGPLETGGAPMILRAHTIRSEGGAIRAFSDEAAAQNGPAGADGQNQPTASRNGSNGAAGGAGRNGGDGVSGASAGGISISATRLIGTLEVVNSGEAGGAGGSGGSGGNGGAGAGGNSGASGAIDCRRGPQSGGNGGAGGAAGSGGDGGAGGNAGTVTITISEPLGEGSRIIATARGGAAGAAGNPGNRGVGGSGGSRGSAPGLCRQTARNGSVGPNGTTGLRGIAGDPGQDGSITISVDGRTWTGSGAVEVGH
ncbi:hypothetical protein [Roseibium sp. MMSF_3412]|uniref:hypothetical protein n=1 Tax=Roseibium sp. MMSF_3412 TaxID=3046712 RepID=UPI00273EBA2B|nr:hypothetical protein [Roseibium sp. MMSF_3412]